MVGICPLTRKSLPLVLSCTAFLFFCLQPSRSDAKNKYGTKVGINFSAFRKNQTDFIYGNQLGLFADFGVARSLGILLEVNYTTRGGILRDVVVEPYGGYTIGAQVYSYDIYCSIAYLEFPFLISYSVPLNQQISLQMYAGPSYSRTIKDKSTRKNQKLVPADEGTIKFDVYAIESSGPTFVVLGISSGFSISYQKALLDLRYFRGFQDIGSAARVEPIPYKTHAVHVSLGFLF